MRTTTRFYLEVIAMPVLTEAEWAVRRALRGHDGEVL